jgi:zinc protease
VLSQEKLDNQRDVVKNERRQRYEITPYGLAWVYLDEALYPVGHPYHHSTIGSHEDLTNATLSDVRGFFEKYYVPSNAALAVVGDFEDAKMRSLIEKYFGDMPAGKRAPTPSPAPVSPLTPKHWIAEDTIQLPRVYFAWLTPELFAPSDAELDLLSNVLTSGKSSRLFQSLVYEQKLAKDVDAFQISQKLNGMYVIQATAAPDTSLDALAAALKKELTLALATPPSESEMNRARNDYKKGFFHRLETYESRAGVLASYFLHTGKGDYVAEDYERYLTPTSTAVQDAGQKYLSFQHAVRLDFIPGKKSTPLKKLELSPSTPKKEAGK